MSTTRLLVILKHCLVPQPKQSTSGLRTYVGGLQSFQTSSKMSSQSIVFPTENSVGDCPGVMFGDASKTKKGLIVLQEWWGMNQQIKNQAEELAKLGPFVTVVPDLYRGKVATDREEAGHCMASLDWPGAVTDIAGAAQFLQKQGCTKVGVTGFCMGGALSFLAAVLVPEVNAAAPFYGIPRDDLGDLSQIKIPIQCHFGSQDNVPNFSSPQDQEILVKKLKNGSVNFEFHSYDAGHAFTNKTSPNYNEKCCNIAMERLVAFMNQNLQ